MGEGICHRGEIRVYGRNKGTRVFSCGQRDPCRLSEAQPQAGNKYGVKIRKMCGKDVLSYGKDVILAKKEQGKQESKAGTKGAKMCGNPYNNQSSE